MLHRCVLIERENLLSSIGRLFASPPSVSTASLLGSFVDEGITQWRDLQNEEWPVDSKQNRTALGFQFLNGNSDRVSSVELKNLREGIREASYAADSECPGQKAFDISHRGHIAPTIRMYGDIEGYEIAALFNADGTYLMGPSFSWAMTNGCGVEIRPGAVRNAVGIRCGAFSGNMKVSFQAARSIG